LLINLKKFLGKSFYELGKIPFFKHANYSSELYFGVAKKVPSSSS
jgi:hypothetical protein